MKKDMAGGATALALAHMIMARKLKVRLRVIIPAVENSISGTSFRPRDIYTSRKGISVEIGNTDAEGRLILADALALADEDKPALIADFATLTGAARVALGPEVPPFFTDDDALAAELARYAAVRERSALAHAAVAALRADARFQGRRHQQCQRPAARAAPSPRRCSCASSWPPNPGCISTSSPGRRRPSRAPGRRRTAVGARALCAAVRALLLIHGRARPPHQSVPPRDRGEISARARSRPRASSKARATK